MPWFSSRTFRIEARQANLRWYDNIYVAIYISVFRSDRLCDTKIRQKFSRRVETTGAYNSSRPNSITDEPRD
jgi:hypothetical protein